MNLWGYHFFQNANQKLQEFLPYQTYKDRSTFFGDFLVSVGSFFGYDPCLFGRAEIWENFGWHFGRNDDLINSFWIQVTFRAFLQDSMSLSGCQINPIDFNFHLKILEIWRLAERKLAFKWLYFCCWPLSS